MNSDELLIELKKCWDEADREKGKAMEKDLMEKDLMVKFYIGIRNKVILDMALSPIPLLTKEMKNDTNSIKAGGEK